MLQGAEANEGEHAAGDGQAQLVHHVGLRRLPAITSSAEYAKGSTAYVQVAAFVRWAIALVASAALAAGSRAPAGRATARRAVVGGFGIAAAGLVLSALFATQTIAGVLPPDVHRTTGGQLHDAGTLAAFAGLAIAAAASLRLDVRRGYRLSLAALAAVLLLTVRSSSRSGSTRPASASARSSWSAARFSGASPPSCAER